VTFADDAAKLLTDSYEMRKFAEDVEDEQYLTPEQKEDEERRKRRRMWAVLGTLGGLGALGTGAYFYPQIRDWAMGKARAAGMDVGGKRPVESDELSTTPLADFAEDVASAEGGAGVAAGAAHTFLGSRAGQQALHRISPRAAEALNKWLPYAAENPNLRGVIDDLRVMQRSPETARARSLGEVTDARSGLGTTVKAPAPGTGGRADRRLGALMNALADPDPAVTAQRAANLADALESTASRGAKLTGSDLHRLVSRVAGEDWGRSRSGDTQMRPFSERTLTPKRLAQQLEAAQKLRTTGRMRQRPDAGRLLTSLERATGADPHQLAGALKQYGTRNPLRGGGSTDIGRLFRRSLAAPLGVWGASAAAEAWPYGGVDTMSTDPQDVALMQAAQEAEGNE